MKISFEHFTLANGLQVYVHEDHTINRVAINLLYNVGARDENPEHTGFAHLFEHLMFGGSKNIPKYDEIAQNIGAENNAFTDNDMTNYYLITPSNQLESAFWLESDRMAGLDFSQKSLDVQRNVVCEEFKQRYLNQPYGDVWLKLRPLVYKQHPYQWATIGKELKHIEDSTLEQVENFFNHYYLPNNCILSVAGDCTVEQIKHLTEKWFASIPAGKRPIANYPKESIQNKCEKITVKADVPIPALYMAYHVPERNHKDYYALEILSTILSQGKSAYLYQKMVKEQQIANNVSTFQMGSLDPGMFVFSAQPNGEIALTDLEEQIKLHLERYKQGHFDMSEVEKAQNQAEFYWQYQLTSLFNKAFYIAYHALLGDAESINQEMDNYLAVTKEDIIRVANQYFVDTNCSVLYYETEELTTAE